MLDSVSIQRSIGVAEVGLDRGRVTGLRQSGSAKVLLPRSYGARPEIVFLNTSGGLTAGDRLNYRVDLAAGTAALATTQTAERAYRAEGGAAQARVALSLGQGAQLDWLPQETILFDGAALVRETGVDLAPDARFLGVETLILGRAASGEVLRRQALCDTRRIRRDGRLLLVDPVHIDGGVLARAAGAAVLNGAKALATLVLAEGGAGDALAALRAELNEPGVTSAASARPGLVVVRCLSADGWPLRRQLTRLIARLRPGGLPRVWQS